MATKDGKSNSDTCKKEVDEKKLDRVEENVKTVATGKEIQSETSETNLQEMDAENNAF